MLIPDCTLVTACFNLTKYNINSRSFSDSIKNFNPLLSLPVYLVIYCSPDVTDILRQERQKHGLEELTLFISQEYEELWVAQFTEKVKKNREVYWPTRDQRTCAESHLVCSSKFDFVLKVMEKNPFKTSKFGWIDGNIRPGQNNKICEDYMPSKILHLLSNISDNKFYIQRLNVVDKKYKIKENKKEYYNQYRWLVCGCLFLCNYEIGTKILKRLNEIFVETTDLGYGHGEEMYYLEVLDEFYDDFHFGYGDYGQLVNNMISPRKNINYIYEYILKGFFNKKYYREAYDCSNVLIKEASDYNINIIHEDFLNILFINYISSYYCKKEETQKINEYILSLCDKNPLIGIHLKNIKQRYKGELEFIKSQHDKNNVTSL